MKTLSELLQNTHQKPSTGVVTNPLRDKTV